MLLGELISRFTTLTRSTSPSTPQSPSAIISNPIATTHWIVLWCCPAIAQTGPVLWRRRCGCGSSCGSAWWPRGRASVWYKLVDGDTGKCVVRIRLPLPPPLPLRTG